MIILNSHKRDRKTKRQRHVYMYIPVWSHSIVWIVVNIGMHICMLFFSLEWVKHNTTHIQSLTHSPIHTDTCTSMNVCCFCCSILCVTLKLYYYVRARAFKVLVRDVTICSFLCDLEYFDRIPWNKRAKIGDGFCCCCCCFVRLNGNLLLLARSLARSISLLFFTHTNTCSFSSRVL